MFPSSSKVKLNRVALKDVIGLRLGPRRRRVPKSPSNVTTDSNKQDDKHVGCDTSSNEPVQTLLTDQMIPENVPETAGRDPGETCAAGTLQPKRRNNIQSCKRKDMELKQQGTITRDIDRNVHLRLTGLAGSEGSLRRAVRASSCGLCGDRKYVFPQQKTLGKQGQKRGCPGAEQPVFTVTPKKFIVWIDRYPKVTLCDVAQKCDATSHDSGIVLSGVLKTKVVRCFKQDMRAGFQRRPGCLGHIKHGSEESAPAKNSGLCLRVQTERSICQPQSLTENPKHLKEHTDAETPSGHTTGHFLKDWASEASATCSSSFPLGTCTDKGECRTAMWDKDVEEVLGPGYDFMGDKRVKLGDGTENSSLPFTSDLENISSNDPAKTRDKEKTCSGMSADSQSCLELAVGSCRAFSSAVKDNCVHKNPGKTDAALISSELFCQRTDLDTDDLESLTCQRVRVYFRKTHFSCARTYVSWPFSNSGHTLAADAGTAACPAEPIDPSARGNRHSSINQNKSGSTSNQASVMLPNAATDSSPNRVSPRNEERGENGREEDGEKVGGHDDASLNSSTGGNMEFVPLFREKSLTSPLSDIVTVSNPGSQREPGTETVSVPSASPANGPQTDSSMSTPSPAALGLSEWETATLSHMSSPFPHGGLSSLSVTPSSLPPSSFLMNKVKGVELPDAQTTCVTPTSSSSSPKYIIKTVKDTLICCEETQMTCTYSSSTPPHNSNSFHSCDSSILFPQEEQESDGAFFTSRSSPKPEPYYNTSPCNHDVVGKERSLHVVPAEQGVYTESNMVLLPPLLSPLNSPQWHSRTNFLPQRPCSLDEEQEEEDMRRDTNRQTMLNGHHMPQIVDGDSESCKNDLEHCVEFKGKSPDFKTLTDDTLREFQSSLSSDEDVDDGNEEESQDETDGEDDEVQGSKSVLSDPKIKENMTSGVLRQTCSSPSGDDDDDDDNDDDDDGGVFNGERQPLSIKEERSSSSEIAGSERHKTEAEAAGDTQSCIFDEFTAYEQDILLVDVIQDDPELFDNLPQKSVLKLGPTRVSESPKTRPTGVVKTPVTHRASVYSEQRLTPVNIDSLCDSSDITEESVSRPWRPQCSSRKPFKMQSNTLPVTDKQTKTVGQSDANNNHVNGDPERNQTIQTVNSTPNHVPLPMSVRSGPANMTEFRRQKSNIYCRQYFTESLSCGFKMCRFQHVPVEGDEKFCVDTVTRFSKNPVCLQKAGAVFTGYYQSNPPGAYFSMPVLLSLLWALLKAGMVPDVFSVLSVSLTHKIVPDHEFLLALFNYVREKGLMVCVPELIQLTFKMASAGLVLSLDCFDYVKNTPEFMQTVYSNSPVSVSDNHKLSVFPTAPFPEYLNLAQSLVEIELCTKQENWRRMGEVFKSICQPCQHPNQVERISGSIAVALLCESKDKLSLPFAAFSETVCQSQGEDSLIRSLLGRIGVSLMLRYHKTHQWAKGRRVVEVLSFLKVNYSMLKGLFGNEDRASRCYLVTVATELFLLSGSVEGALNTLRDNNWFLTSSPWPCELADLESRSRVLMRLAEKTSHRDTLEVLSNLPGIKEPNDMIDISRYIPLFNSHLQVCVDRQILPVASDTVDFMLFKNLAVDHTMLQLLLHKLGKQNLWLRAREVFRHSLSVGYYAGVSAPPGFMALIVPCRLGEIELALAFEMFITVNATVIVHLTETTTSCLSITLKRTQSCESEYLSAGSRLLSAACIPQPKLIVHYTAVNSSREQVFTLDISSARHWLRRNHLWANEVWTH